MTEDATTTEGRPALGADPEPTPGFTNGEVLDGPLIRDEVVGVPYVDPSYGDATGSLTMDGMTAALAFAGGPPDSTVLVGWGEGDPVEEVVTDATGKVVATHTYAEAGTYTVMIDNESGATIYIKQVTAVAPEPPPEEDDEPEPEPEPEPAPEPEPEPEE